MAQKQVKIFKKRDEAEFYVDLDGADIIGLARISGVEDLEDNSSRVKLVDNTNDED